MKKITLLLAMALGTFAANAQNDYTFTVQTGQTYTNLEGATSINNGDVWDYDYFGEFTMPFSFGIAGQAVDRFYFDDDYFGLLAPGATADEEEGVFLFVVNNLFVQDIAYDSGNSNSPLSYKVEGTTGNRILKLEMKNAGLEDIELSVATNGLYLNFQVWLYESDKSIEIHYGDSNVTTAYINAFINEGEQVFTTAIAGIENVYLLTGNSANPTYGEYTENTLPASPNLSGYPASGTVYRFAPAGTTNAPVFARNNFSLYPNPASTVVNIRANDVAEGQYAVYNMLGAVVAQGSLTGTDTAINTASLQEGVYVIKVDNQNLKFIKK
ncbi:hypothetical protein AM493_15550 [Flavobacterium akiainvivens]|uniref:Secretion system C-terminal sorting domain-containing protein n=1 Tax=Flavobacterium akiainvivens TaxID=1202724 RepID=A0A0M9VJ28_9FLAO|nr:T9SS type A sorting domain-containing protein [Flavobacterium akiainvivens]KOS07296.1 hypothetical protein AM493_15550 [Flavobacterium akiainvivens]SFQ46321.1 Por secretion system C-terminal sorting domain-containing protein [Flavobacterium akiainvivens]